MPESIVRERDRARTMAALLAGAWRASPPDLALTNEELIGALPLIARTRAAALVWWRLRNTPLGSLPEVERLRDAYRYAALETASNEARVKAILATLRSASIDTVLIKGWAVARLYPQTNVRPYEDIDLLVSPGDQSLAEAALRSSDARDAVVDFHHAEITEFDDKSWAELWSRTEVVNLAGTSVRLLSPEDHLRAICIHGLRHCFSNPLWLCDVAAGIEGAGNTFDWERFFGTRDPQAQWIGCAIGLAEQLLGCDVPLQASRRLRTPLPRWLIPVVLDAWLRWAIAGPNERWAIAELREKPWDAFGVVARRWPNQVVVALKRRAPLVEQPAPLEWLQQLAYLFDGERLLGALRRRKAERSMP